jgi:hypothetical protein
VEKVKNAALIISKKPTAGYVFIKGEYKGIEIFSHFIFGLNLMIKISWQVKSLLWA